MDVIRRFELWVHPKFFEQTHHAESVYNTESFTQNSRAKKDVVVTLTYKERLRLNFKSDRNNFYNLKMLYPKEEFAV